jgi:hypothetical protein
VAGLIQKRDALARLLGNGNVQRIASGLRFHVSPAGRDCTLVAQVWKRNLPRQKEGGSVRSKKENFTSWPSANELKFTVGELVGVGGVCYAFVAQKDPARRLASPSVAYVLFLPNHFSPSGRERFLCRQYR